MRPLPRSPEIQAMTTLLSPKVFVLPLLALVVIASLPRQGESQAPATTAVACAASLPSDAMTRRQTSKPVCEPGRGHLAQERATRTIQ
jgi:hypothetical protein